MGARAGWSRDWRAWAFLCGTVLLGVLDLVAPASIEVLSFLMVPIVGSAMLGSASLTGTCTVIALVAGAAASVPRIGEPTDYIPHLLAIAFAGAVASFLAVYVERSQSALATARDRFRRYAEIGSDVIGEGSSDGRTTWLSPSVTRLLGWRPEELTGRPVAELVHPEDRSKVLAAHDGLERGEVAHFDARLATADGGWRWVAISVENAVAADGEVRRLAAWRDIQPERDAAEALLESEERYRLLAENATDVVFATRADRLVTWVSPNVTQALGWEPEEIEGTLLTDLVHPEDRAGADEVRKRAYAGHPLAPPATGFVGRLATKDGDYRWMSGRAATIHGPDGEPEGIVGSLTVVDDLVVARQRAEAGESRLRAVMDTMFDPHVLFVAIRDEQGEIVDFIWGEANEAACAYNGVSKEDAIGRSLREIMPESVAQALIAQNAHIVETGEPVVVDDFTFPGDDRYFDIRSVRVGEAVSSTWRDVSARHRESEAVRESERQFRLLAENSTDVVLHLRDDHVVWASPSLMAMLGWQPDEWRGRAFTDFVNSGDLPALDSAEARLREGASVVARGRLLGSDGGYHWVEVHAQPYFHDDGALDGIVASFRTIDVQVQAERELERRARFDDLTGLLKRNEALSRLHEIGQHLRKPGDETAALFIDVDGFKAVNDTWGHAAGDAMLQALAQRIRGLVRSADTVARMGGDEFLVILEGLHSIDEANGVAEKILLAAQEPVRVREGVVTATVSIGVTMSNPIESADDMVTRADQAMYEAKRSGRNRIVTVPFRETVN